MIITFLRSLLTYLLAFLNTLLVVPGIILAARRSPTSPRIERLAAIWARGWLVGAGIRLEVTGLEHIDPARSYVAMSNHQSNLDPMCHFLALGIPLRFLAKKELFSIPLFGTAIRAMGMVAVDRSRPSHDSINHQVEQAIAAGRSLIIYPEGTRSHDAEVAAFKKGPFAIAIHSGLPVLPVTIDGTFALWRRDTFLIRPGTVRIVVGPPVPTGDLSEEDIALLRESVREQVIVLLREMRSGVAQS